MELIRGSRYTRAEIRAAFGGQWRGGISTPRAYPMVILYSNKEGARYGYRDEWKDDGFFHYTGEGQYGPMQMTKGNRAIRDHAKERKALVLFQQDSQGLYEFAGYMEYAGHYVQDIPDEKGAMRPGIIFKLSPVAEVQLAGANAADGSTDRTAVPLEDLRERALEASRLVVEKSTRMSTWQERSRAVAQYVLQRAQGFCEGCGAPAPFLRQNGREPYLEVHHIYRLSEEGPDAPGDVIALCPTCHRKVHYGCGGDAYNRLELAKTARSHEDAAAKGRLKFVTAAVMYDDGGRILVCRRSSGALAGYWEFPGGKLREGEEPEACLRREIDEELCLTLDSVIPFLKVDYDYPDFRIRLLCFRCSVRGAPIFVEHSAGRWVPVEELGNISLAPADSVVARRLLSDSRISSVPMAADRGSEPHLAQ